MDRNTPIFLFLLLLGGCNPFTETLNERMAGKSPDEKRVVLADTCGQEIAKSLKKDDLANVRHSEKMKQICEEMTRKKVNIYADPNREGQ